MSGTARAAALIGVSVLEAFAPSGAQACDKPCRARTTAPTAVTRQAPDIAPAEQNRWVFLGARQTVETITTRTTTEVIIVVPPTRGTAIEERQQNCGNSAAPRCGGGGD